MQLILTADENPYLCWKFVIFSLFLSVFRRKIADILPILKGKNYRFLIEKDEDCMYFMGVQSAKGRLTAQRPGALLN